MQLTADVNGETWVKSSSSSSNLSDLSTKDKYSGIVPSKVEKEAYLAKLGATNAARPEGCPLLKEDAIPAWEILPLIRQPLRLLIWTTSLKTPLEA